MGDRQAIEVQVVTPDFNYTQSTGNAIVASIVLIELFATYCIVLF